MTIRHSLLALLSQQPMYGAALRAQFEARTGGTWPLNVGQVYTTLGRLERDGLVESAGAPDAEGRIPYRLTETGRAAAEGWWSTPVEPADAPRDELVIKLALAVTMPEVDSRRVVQTQRTATMRHLRELTRRKIDTEAAVAAGDTDRAWLLVVENHLFATEAQLRWLDHVETLLDRTDGETDR